MYPIKKCPNLSSDSWKGAPFRVSYHTIFAMTHDIGNRMSILWKREIMLVDHVVDSAKDHDMI